MEMKKPCAGRQKIAISKIPKKNHLQVTFSKRRTGVFKKASELSTLCGIDIAIIVFSPANKAFSFGHPNVDSIIDRYLARNSNPPSESGTNRLIEAHRNANIRELNMQLTQVLHQLEVEKKHGEVMSEIRRASRSQCWWEAPINELGLHELEQLKTAMEELKKNVEQQANKILIDSKNNPSPSFGVNNQNINPHHHQSKLPLGIPASSNDALPNFYSSGFGHYHDHQQ
ncbi:hypothetical protein AB3S75_043631 [Citrus x aurantiifolia]